MTLALFVQPDRRAAHPVVPLMVLHRRDFSFGVANELASNFAYIGGFILALNTCRERRAPAEGSRNLAAVPATGAGADRPG